MQKIDGDTLFGKIIFWLFSKFWNKIWFNFKTAGFEKFQRIVARSV